MKANYKKMLSLAALVLAMGVTAVAGKTEAAVEKDGHKYEVSSVVFKDDGTATITWSSEDEGAESYTTTEKATVKSEKQEFPCVEGEKIYTLKVDGATYDSEAFTIAPTAEHKYEKDVVVITAATCEAGGKVREDQVCSVCGDRKTGEEKDTDALDHKWTITYEDLNNVTVDADGNATLVDKAKDGSYIEVKTCANGSAHTGENPVKTTKTVSATTGSTTEGETVPEYIDGSEKDNVVINGDKVTLKDCTKDGKYKMVTKDASGKVLKESDPITIKAGHTNGKPVAEKPSENVEISYDKDGNIVATNKSCAKEGSYEAVVTCEVCGKEVSRTKVTVAKSTVHTPATEKKYENDTATCQKDGKRDEITVCAICGEEISRKNVDSPKKDHEGLAPVVENEKKATAHQGGSYDSVVYCKWGGEELSRTTVTTKPTNPDEYTWEYKIVWSDEDSFVGNARDYSIARTPKAWMEVTPTDSDLTKEEIAKLKMSFNLTVKEDEAKAVKADSCHLGQRTFVATVSKDVAADIVSAVTPKTAKANAPKAETIQKMTDTQAYNYNDDYVYVGHKWGKYTYTVLEEATTEKEGKAAFRRTCKVCGDVDDQWYETIPKLKKDEEPTEEPTPVEPEVKKISLKEAVIKGTATFRGEYFNVPFTVTLNGKQLEENTDFVLTNARKNNFRTVGSHTIKIAGIGNYTGTAKGKITITKANQNIKMSKTKKTFKASTLKKKAASFITTITNAHGKLSYKTSSKMITFKKVAVGTYKVTAKKGTTAGKYTITINFATSKSYNAAKKTITVTVK